jgi:hypothetical protein
MAQAQERFDWKLPPSYFDSDADNAAASWDDAVEVATEQHLSCGSAVADVLVDLCEGITGDVETKVGELCQSSTGNRDDYDPMGRPVHELLAVVMLGGDVSALRALRFLRAAVAAGMEREINDAAEVLLKGEEA